MRTCPFKAWRLNERSALVARECRRNLMHEMDGMLEAWLGARGTHSLRRTEPAGGWQMRPVALPSAIAAQSQQEV